MIFISFLLGLIFGSFANVCIVRLPKNVSVVIPRSQCVNCGAALRAWHNLPVISFVALLGRCHHCHEKISRMYPTVELTMGLLFSISAWTFRHAPSRIILADTLVFYLLTISIIDYYHRIIPDELSISMALVGVLTSPFNPFLEQRGVWRIFESLACLLIGGLGMLLIAWLGELVFKKEALGGGDIKLVAAVGAFLGWGGLFGSLCFGSFLGAGLGLILLVAGRKARGDTLPFGPFLSLGALSTLILPMGWLRLIFP